MNLSSPTNYNNNPIQYGSQMPQSSGNKRDKAGDLIKSEGDVKGISPFNANDISSITDTFPNLTHLEEKDLKIAVSKLRRQNDHLREQLRDLSLKLTDVLDKAKPKMKGKEDRLIEFKEDTLAKELENSKQQLVFYKKELQQLKNRLEVVSGEDRVVKLEVILKQRDQMIEDLGIETKNLQKINRDQEREINTYHKDFGYEKKVGAANEEIASLREKVRDVQNVSKMNEKNFKKQQEYLTNLNHQYTLVCEKVGIPTNFTFSKPEDLNEYLEEKAKNESKGITQVEQSTFTTEVKNLGETTNLNEAAKGRTSPERKKKITDEMIRELQNHEAILQRQLQSLDKKYQFKISKLKTDISEIQNNTSEYEAKIRQKELEISNLEKKVNELKKVTKKSYTNLNEPLRASDRELSAPSNFNSSKPLTNEGKKSNEKYPNVNTHNLGTSQPQTNKTSPKNKTTSPTKIEKKEEPQPQPLPPQTREVAGGRIEEGLLEFGDDDILEDPATSKVVKVTVWVGEKFLNGIQMSYRINNSEDVVGNQHLAPDMKGKTKVVESLQIDPDDHITYISGKYSDALISLKLQTAKGKIKDFGDMKSDGEEFEIDVKADEQPTMLFGAFVRRKDKKGKEEIMLANIGFVLVKKTKQ